MTGKTLAKAHWRMLSGEGDDTCRLAQMDDGYMLLGHARFRTAKAWAALDYVVRLDHAWHSLGADVTGDYAGRSVGWQLTRDARGWRLNDDPQAGLENALDVDLSFTPATNLMPIRRLPEVGGLSCCAAWLQLEGAEATLRPLHQSYTRERGGLVRYAAQETGYQTQLQVDPAGFVTLYPDLWDRMDGM